MKSGEQILKWIDVYDIRFQFNNNGRELEDTVSSPSKLVRTFPDYLGMGTNFDPPVGPGPPGYSDQKLLIGRRIHYMLPLSRVCANYRQ